MVVDIKLKDYYLQFINTTKDNIKKYNIALKNITEKRDSLYKIINDTKDILKYKFNIDINKYSEWTEQQYNPNIQLYNKAYSAFNRFTNVNDRQYIIHVIQYTHCLKAIDNINKHIRINTKANKLTYRQYNLIVSKYYNKVHKFVLNGYGYKYQFGIGLFVINHWKIDASKNKKLRLDYNATNKRKKEIIAQGLKPYDEKEAVWYKARHIPYDGVDYKVYSYDSSYYEFCFIKSNIVHSKKAYNYKRAEYVSIKYRGMSYQKIADTYIHSDEDVYDMQLDIKYKLNILLYRNPTIYLKFIRNAEQNRYKH